MNLKLAIVGVGVTSRYGIGTNSFLKGISIDEVKKSSNDYKVPNFDIKSFLGRKIRYINRTTALSLIAMNEVLEKYNPKENYLEEDIGIAIGTNTGSLKVTLDFANETFLQEKPYYVDPSCFPQGILNYMAGNAAIRYGYKGVNVTLSAGKMTGLEIINYAANAIETSQCQTMLVTAVEDSNEYSEYIYHQQNKYLKLEESEFAEGSVCLGLESLSNAEKLGHSVIAEIIDLNIRYFSSLENLDTSLKKLIDDMLKKHHITYDDIYAISPIDNQLKTGRYFEDKYLENQIKRISIKEKLGNALAVTNLFQIVSLLSLKELIRKYCILYAIDENNVIGCALLKI